MPFSLLASTDRRRKQVESLLTELPSLRVVPNDDSRFQLTLTLANGPDSPHITRTTSSPSINSKALEAGIGSNANTATVTLTIYLPPSFPEDEPKITIQPAVRHLWVDGTVQPCAVTGHERLMPGGWSTHANLGRIVKEIVTNIQRTGVLVGETADQSGTKSNNPGGGGGGVYEEYSHKPPPPVPNARSKSLGPNNDRPIPSYNSKTNGGANRFGPQQYMTSLSSSSATQLPLGDTAYGSSLSEETRIVLELPAERVDELLENPIAFEHFVDHLDVVVNSRTLQAEWWGGNSNVARKC